MQSNLRHTFQKILPDEGCVALHLHGVLSTNLNRGSHYLLFPQNKSSVVNVNSRHKLSVCITPCIRRHRAKSVGIKSSSQGMRGSESALREVSVKGYITN
jgi:5-deoxy-D-glucuronate isomerase